MQSDRQASREFSHSIRWGGGASCLALFLLLFCGAWLGLECQRFLVFQAEEDVLKARGEAVHALQEAHIQIEMGSRAVLLNGAERSLEILRSGVTHWKLRLSQARLAYQTDQGGKQKLEALAGTVLNRFSRLEKNLHDFQAGGGLRETWDVDSVRDYDALSKSLHEAHSSHSLRIKECLHRILWLVGGAGFALLFLLATLAYLLATVLRRIAVLETRLVHEAMHESITGLANRHYLLDWLKNQISSAERMDDSFHVLLLDLERLEEVNERYGRDVGDEVLLAAARKVRDIARNGNFAARLGYDKFVLVFSCAPDSREVGRFAARLLRNLQRPLLKDVPAESISASIGVASYPADGKTPRDLIKAANQAMLQARSRGRSCYAYRRESAPADSAHVWEVSRF